MTKLHVSDAKRLHCRESDVEGYNAYVDIGGSVDFVTWYAIVKADRARMAKLARERTDIQHDALFAREIAEGRVLSQ